MPLPILTRPLVCFDLETTGTELSKDRIVEIALIRLEPDGSRTSYESRVHPEMPIPPMSSAIHGIKDEHVKDAPRFRDIAPLVAGYFKNADVTGYNVRRFDIPMLDLEFKRVKQPSPFENPAVVDSFEIFQKMVSHSLDGALKFFCGRSHENAHAAMADVVATMDVLSGQLEKFPELPRELNALADATGPKDKDRFVDPTGKLVRNDAGEPCINFGKYKGRSLEDLRKADEGYLRWIVTKDFHPDVMKAVRSVLEGSVSVKLPLGNIKLEQK